MIKKGLFSIFFISFFFGSVSAQNKLEEVLKKLDTAIEQRDKYSIIKKNRIDVLYNKKINIHNDLSQKYEINMLLYKEYKAYNCDSAILYLQQLDES